MLNTNNGASLSDIAALMNNNDGFGGNNGIWVLVLLWAILGRGYGFGGENVGTNTVLPYGYIPGTGAAENYVLASDFANLERKIDTVNSGLCDGFYAQNTSLLTGFNNMQAMLSQCCCDNKAAFADVKYTMATDTCHLGNMITQMGQNIMQNDNANYRALNDRLTNMEMSAKDETIAQLRQEAFAKNLSCSQDAQTATILAALQNGCGCNRCC